MGGIFGACLEHECAADIFFGTDYHSHLGARRGGMAVFDGAHYNRAIHNIENSPFRTKFESDVPDMKGNIGVGCISDGHPQPIIVNSRIGAFAVVTVGRINNKDELTRQLITENNAYYTEMSDGGINDTEIVASLIRCKDSVPEGIAYAQEMIEGSMTMIVCADGGLYAARDKFGRTPLFVGEKCGGEKGHCVSLESFAYPNLGYQTCYELGPGEILFVTSDKLTSVVPAHGELKICTFLWLYYGFPTSDYEGQNVESMRNRCGMSMAEQDLKNGTNVDVDCVAGIPDSGTAHAIGYANGSGISFARPLIKYTPTWPRSFTAKEQSLRKKIAQMKLTPVNALIRGKKLLLIDDSIVRGTQLGGLMNTLFAVGAKELHARIACPPILFGCKYLNFTRSQSENDNIARRVIGKLENKDNLSKEEVCEYAEFGTPKYHCMVEEIRKIMNFTTLEYHSLAGMLKSVGLEPCKLCTYCWNGQE